MERINFKIGVSREVREAFRRTLLQRRVIGVYMMATMMGYRDANLINNYSGYPGNDKAALGASMGDIYSLPVDLNRISHKILKDDGSGYEVKEGMLADITYNGAEANDLTELSENLTGLAALTEQNKIRQDNVFNNISTFHGYNGTTYYDFPDMYKFPDKAKVREQVSGKGNDSRIYAYENGLFKYHQRGKVKMPSGYSEIPSIEEFDDIKNKTFNPEKSLTYLNKYNSHSKDSVYGISTGENDEDYYRIPSNVGDRSNKIQKGGIVINPDYKKGSTRTDTHHEASNVSNYNFYDERNVEGQAVHTKDNDNGMSNGSTFNFMDASELKANSMLETTNRLFSKGKIKSLINRFATTIQDIEANPSIAESAYNNVYGMSRGRNLVKKNITRENGYLNPYCRVWTSHHQYSNLKDRIRPFIENDESGKFMSIKETQSKFEDLRPNEGSSRLNEHSSLMNNGYVRIAPMHLKNNGEYQQDIKKCMFSIENLAWRDVHIEENLSEEQRGPNKGRIMWFPPYNLKFNENINAQWSSNEFIGRGENIYTYTNTERNGILSFTILIDHPSIMNKWRGMAESSSEGKYKDEQTLLRFFAGCDNLSDEVSAKNLDIKVEKKVVVKNDPKPVEYTKTVKYIMFFPNDFSSIDKNDGESVINNIKRYEYASGIEWGNTRDNSYKDEKLKEKNIVNKNSKYFFNKSIELSKDLIITELGLFENEDIHSFDDLIKYVGLEEVVGGTNNEYRISGVDVQGYASSHGYEKNNLALCSRRASAIASVIKYKYNISDDLITRKNGNIIQVKDAVGDKDVNSIEAKIARCAIATFHIKIKGYQGPTNSDGTESDINVVYERISNEKFDELVSQDITGNMRAYGAEEFYDGAINPSVATASSGKNMATITETVKTTPKYKYDNEYMYFKNLEYEDKLAYKNIIDKIQYFSPAFHSITPEGFNARLTFLQQCMRQGPTQTIGNQDGSVPAGNLAFGRAPYCILRIGDFFNTKIVITSISIDYDTGSGVLYDLNPEGIGVQPMMANVTMNFNFIGGQDIAGPVDRLQNAVSYNYYANTSIYDRHADYYIKHDGESKVLSQYDAMNPGEADNLNRKTITSKIQ